MTEQNKTSPTGDKPFSPFDMGIRLYNEPKHPDDADLVAIVRDYLLEAGVPEDTLQATFDLNREINAAKGRVSIAQRQHINKFLVLALFSTPKDTIAMQAELLPNGQTGDWAEHVKTVVAPFISENKLLG